MKLLLIEQSVILNRRLAKMLAAIDGVEMVETPTAIEDAIGVMQSTRPEMVVIDIQLPDSSGINRLARVRGACPSACLIVLSYALSETYKKRWLEAGADYCYDIAIQIDQLLKTVGQKITANIPAS